MPKRQIDDTICYVCHQRIHGYGMYHADLRIRTHLEACAARVDAERRVYDRSARGRWRPRAAVLARLRKNEETQ
jgi:hypothetical protein